MHKMLLCFALSLMSAAALAEPRVDCSGCTTLREFGNFGAASLYRATGPAGPAVGSDQIWVDNPGSGASVFVDVDTPTTVYTIMGTQIPIPDLTQMEINATWGDGAGAETWVLPNAVLGAIAASIEAAENSDTPEVTPAEIIDLPGLGGGSPWQPANWGVMQGGSGSLSSGVWIFTVTGFGGEAVPVVTLVECAWQSLC